MLYCIVYFIYELLSREASRRYLRNNTYKTITWVSCTGSDRFMCVQWMLDCACAHRNNLEVARKGDRSGQSGLMCDLLTCRGGGGSGAYTLLKSVAACIKTVKNNGALLRKPFWKTMNIKTVLNSNTCIKSIRIQDWDKAFWRLVETQIAYVCGCI